MINKLVTLFYDPENGLIYSHIDLSSPVLTKTTTKKPIFFREADGHFLSKKVESFLLKMCHPPTVLEHFLCRRKRGQVKDHIRT